MSKFARGRRPSGRPAPASPVRRRPITVEQLEARETPATFTWTGAGADNRWATPQNWEGNASPTGDPANREDLVFPAGAARPTSQNDLFNAAFNSITYGGSNFRLLGNEITLGIPGVVGSGAVVVNDQAKRNELNFNVRLGADGGSDQTFSVNAGAELTVFGRLTGATGSSLTKDGTGTLVLANDNSGFTGPIRVDDNSGRLIIGHRLALGTAAVGTTVGTNSTLGVMNVSGAITEPLRLNGPGAANDGALNNLAGNNIWAGPITLDSNVTIGAAADVLIVTAQINDSGSGYDLTKEGPAEVRLNTGGGGVAGGVGNTYRGRTFVNNGILTVGHPRALGTAGAPANGTVVNRNFSGAGQLRLADPTGFGFTVVDEDLILNGTGIRSLANQGAFTNTAANNTWAGPVTLGSPNPDGTDVWIGAAAGTDLTVSGVVSSPNGPFNLTKVDFGRLVLNNANTYTSTTYVAEGTLTARDSKALSQAPAGVDAVQRFSTVSYSNDATEFGGFQLTFRRHPAPPNGSPLFLPPDATAKQVEDALNAMPSVGGVGGKVAVTLARKDGPDADNNTFPDYIERTYTVTFGGTLGKSVIDTPVTVQRGFGFGPFDVGAATTVTGGGGSNERQQFRVHRPFNGDNPFRLAFNDKFGFEETTDLTFDATPAEVEDALTKLDTVGKVGGTVTVTRDEEATTFGPVATYTVTFGGTLANQDLRPIGVRDQFGADVIPAAVIADPGAGAGSEVQALHVLRFRDGQPFGPSTMTLRVFPPRNFGPDPNEPLAVTTVAVPINVTADDLEIALNAVPSIVAVGGRVSVRKTDLFADPGSTAPGAVGSRYVILFGGGLAGMNVPQIEIVRPPDVPFPAVAGSTYTLLDGGRAGTIVDDRATLEFGVEAGDPSLPRFDAQGRDLGNDSVTGDPNRLRFDERLNVYGRGVNQAGALRSVTGLNVLASDITLGSEVALGPSWVSAASVGVEPDARPGHPTPDASYFTSDYSLTVTGVIKGQDNVTFKKRGTGHLILPTANEYTGLTQIEQGWVTAQNDNAFGAYDEDLGPTTQPRTVVFNRAAVHLKTLTPVSPPIDLKENLTLTGFGPAHPYSLIGTRGALLNVGGANTLSGDIALRGTVGFGVETVAGNAASDLAIQGSVSSAPNTQTFDWATFGRTQEEQAFLVETGTNSGTVSVAWNFGPPQIPFIFSDYPDRLTVHYPPRQPGGGPIIFDSGYVYGGGGADIPYGPGAADQTELEFVINEGNKPDVDYLNFFIPPIPNLWTFTVTLPEVPDGVVKLGSGRLALRGDGTYDGPNEVRSGTLTVQNDSALGRQSTGTYFGQQTFTQTTTTAATGAVVEFAEGLPRLNGGVRAGVQVWNERLILNGPGQQLAIAGAAGTFTLRYRTQTTTALPVGATAAQIADALNALPLVQSEVGSVAVTRTGGVATVRFGTARSAGVPLLVATASGGAEVVVSGGNASVLTSSGDNAWRGPITLNAGDRTEVLANARLYLLGAIDDAANPAAAGSDLVKRGVGELSLGGANTFRGTTAIDEGTVTALSGTAFGTADGGTVVADGAQLQLEGSLTVSGEALTVRGSGPAAAQNVPARWFGVGPGPTNNGVSPINLPTSGRITSTATDPQDPNVIYLASAGGGAWKTKDGGRTWIPLFDQNVHPAGAVGDALLYGGSIAIAPSEPRVVYFATGESNGADIRKGIFDSYAGSGVYKSTDGGETWSLLFSPGDDNPLAGQSVSKILVDPNDPDTLYVASSTRAGSVANRGSGRQYRVTFDGTFGDRNIDLMAADDTGDVLAYTTTVLNGRPEGPNPPNPPRPPLDEQQLVKVFGNNGTFTLSVKDPGSNTVYTTAALALDATAAQVDAALEAALPAAADVTVVATDGVAPTPGVWRYRGEPGNGGVWRNLTSVESTSPARSWPSFADLPPGTGVPGQAPFDVPNGIGPPDLPGPDDDYRIVFPQENASWSDLVFSGGVLYAALGEATEQPFVQNGGRDYPLQYAIERTVYQTANPDSDNPTWLVGNGGTDTRPSGSQKLGPPPNNGYIKLAGADGFVWAVITQAGNPNNLFEFQYSFGGGNWTRVANNPPPNLFGPPGQQQGRWDIAVDYDPNTGRVYVGGRDRIFFTDNLGQDWTSLNPDGRGAGPARFFHEVELVPATGDLVAATDGGVWRFSAATQLWQNLNGNLAVTQFFSADAHPTDFTQALGGARNNGTQRFRNGTAWERVDDDAGTETTAVKYDSRTPRTAYAIRSGQLRKTTDGGATWAAVPNGASAAGLVVDPVNPNRVVIGGFQLRESVAGGAGLVNLNAPRATTVVAAAAYQGPFQPDPDFPLVTDLLSNTYTPATLYATDGTDLFLTKNRGVSWVFRTPPGAAGGEITDVAVDPANRDTVYVAVNRPSGATGGRVFRTTDAGRNWTDITGVLNPAGPDSGPLPAVPTWKLAVDPRPDNTAVYVGNDAGVWRLGGARTADPAAAINSPNALVWNRVGAGLPQVAVRDIVLNQTLNTLTAATYGRGLFQLFLPDPAASSGAIRAISGSSVWTGPITLAGPTTIGTAGSQNIQNGVTPAELNVLGRIGGPASATLTKIGRGTLTLSGTNTYAGQTVLAEGVLSVTNARALGAANAAANDTLVQAGTALELRSDLEAENVTAVGRGFLFNGHFTGAVRNVSNDNVYTGTLTLVAASPAPANPADPAPVNPGGTIGVDSGSSLTVGSKPGVLSGTGTLTDGAATLALDKELTGTLILASANAYDGLTRVVAGALQVQHANALGAAAAGTVVLDGAQLQVARNAVSGANTVVASEPLTLSGTGLNRTGALQGGAGDNTYRGPITFDFRPNFAPLTSPPSQVAIGTAGADNNLTVDTALGVAAGLPAGAFGLAKVGTGRVTLARANDYAGSTTVEAGTLRIQDDQALGTAATDGGSPEVQTVTVFGTTGNFTLTFSGQTTAPIAVGASAAAVQAALEALSNLAAGDVFVLRADVTAGAVYTVVFTGGLAGTDVPQLVGAPASNPAVSVATARPFGLGTVVSAGATLELDGSGGALTLNEVLTINGDGVPGTVPGDGAGGRGAVRSVAGTNVYAAPITLGSDASLGAFDGTTLRVTGPVRDPNPAAVPPSRVRKAGLGTVELTAANPYAGRTVVDDGVLRVTNTQALGSTGAEVQSVLVLGTNGTFSLAFGGEPTPALAFDATAADVQTALNALTGIGGAGGSVAVSRTPEAGGFRYRITFGGVLAGANVPELTAEVTGGTQAFPLTESEGPEGTTVNPGGTLQVAGGQAFTREFLTARGNGFNGLGALNSSGGNNTWGTPITLAATAALGTAGAGDTLTLTRPTTDEGNKFGVDVVGPGTVAYAAAADSGYTGTTTVRAGTLLLNQTSGLALVGPLVVAGGTAREARGNQIGDAVPVTVNATGTFDLNGQSDTVGVVTVNDGTVRTGANGRLTLPNTTTAVPALTGLVMAGGTVDIGAGGRVVLNGNLSATSSALGSAVISGPAAPAAAGVLDLNGGDRTVNVADGPQDTDLRVSALLQTSGTAKLFKDGAGRLTFNPGAATTTTVPVTVRNGEVQVDTAIGAVELGSAAAVLSGAGTVGAVRGSTGASSPAVGTVSPGSPAVPAGILRAGTTRWGAQTTYRLTLGRAGGAPVAGADYDQLQVSGAITLGGATLALSGAVGSAVRVNDEFVVLTASGGVTGRFAEPDGAGVVFLGGQKFAVAYEATRVVLTKALADVSVAVASSANPATLNQPVTFTATVTPEAAAAGADLTGTFVKFFIDGVDRGNRPVVNGVATFTTSTLSDGEHSVSVRFLGDGGANFGTAQDTLDANQVIETPAIADPAAGPAVVSPTNPTSVGTQDALTGSATVTEERAVTTFTITVTPAGGGAAVRTTTGSFTGRAQPTPTNTFTIPLAGGVLWDGRTDGGAAAPDGDYLVTVAFSDEFGNAGQTTPVAVKVDDTSPVVGGVNVPNRRFTPGVSRRLLDATITEANLTGWTATLRNLAGQTLRTFTGTGATVAVDFDGTNGAGANVPDGAYTLELVVTDAGGNAATVAVPGNVLVLAAEPGIGALTASETFFSPTNSPSVQDTVRFTATVSQVSAPTATWTVSIRNAAGTVVRTFTQPAVINTATKTFPIAVTWNGQTGGGVQVPDGVYTATATFTDAFGLTGTSAPVSVTVDNVSPTAGTVASSEPFIAPGTSAGVATQTNLTSTAGDGNLRDWTLTVRNAAGQVVRTFTGTGTAVAAAWDGRDAGGNVVADGTYSVGLVVRDQAGNTTAGTAGSVVVLTRPPAVTLASNSPTVYGQTITLTATLTVPAGVTDRLADVVVDFARGGVALGSAPVVVAGGVGRATITISTFDAGTYTDLTAASRGTAVFLPSTPATATHTVTPAVVNVQAGGQGKVYGAPVGGLVYQTSGLVNGDTPEEVFSGSLATTATAASPVGSYPVTRGTLAANGNYAVNFTPGTLVVTPAPLVVRANDATRVVGAANPPFTASYEGLVNGDTPAVVNGLALTTNAGVDSRVGSYPIVAGGNPTAANYQVTTAAGTLRVVPAPTEVIVGSGRGTPAGAVVYGPDGSPRGSLANPFPGFAGGVRVVAADFNRDGVQDYVLGTGPGTPARFVVLDGTNQSELFSDVPFGEFPGGLYVAAGDVDGDGGADLVVTPDEGGGPRVTVYRGGDFSVLRNYFGINDPAFRGGARAGVGDMNNDGFADIVVSAGFGGGPRVSVWDGASVADPGSSPRTLFGDFFAFEPSLRNGTFASIGDVNGDGFGDLIVGAGPGGGPRVTVFDGLTLLRRGTGDAVAAPLANFFAGNPANRGGVRVAAKFLDGDLFADVVTGPGEGDRATGTAYKGSGLANKVADPLFELPGFDDLNGVFVG